MSDDRDEDSGRYTEQYAREAFIDAVGTLEHATTTAVAAEVGCSYDLAYRRLTALAEEEAINCEKIGSTFIWLL